MQIEVITGPTASGKTSVALVKARSDSRIEIVNADASLIYKGFDIGTAKPTIEERGEIPHHLIDILEPDQPYNAADYSDRARAVIREIIARDRQPVIVGGTGFYIDALFFGLATTDVDEQTLKQSRAEYESELDISGFDAMLEKLKPVDPVMFEQISRERNPRRLQRAWEFYLATGTPLGEARKVRSDAFEHTPIFTVLLPERNILHERIAARIDAMLDNGWLEELENLLATGITEEMPAMKAIGYKTLLEVLRSRKSIAVAREEILIQTRQYAKRQVTWMKKYV